MENILKNKLLIILVLFTILINIICLSVFAESESETYTYAYSCSSASKNLNICVDDIEGYSRHLVFIGEVDNCVNVYVYYFNEGATFTIGQNGLLVHVPSDDSVCWYAKSSSISNFYSGTTWSFPSSLSSNVHEGETSFSTSFYKIAQSVKTYYGQANVLDSEGNVVFQGAPHAQVAQVELMKPTQVEEILPQIIAIVEIVLPIFLGIFGILLVLYLIKFKNLLHL